MSSIITTARKELRAYFLSPVALIFLVAFLGAVLLNFFWVDKFFARNIADVRPLFSGLPVLLILLVSAISMRAWSEEQKMGTLEVLLTLPIRTRDLVLGKFVAGMTLVTLALALTLALPITVGQLGELDWGPVIGGYMAALLLAAMYLSIGLWVSALTDNQLVALMVTGFACGALYVIGHDFVVDLVSIDNAEILLSLGSGSRFASIERGVLDLRDLAYYGSLTAFFLLMNGVFLERKRFDRAPSDGRHPRLGLALVVILALLNVAALNLWLAPLNTMRVDLTADGEYSISDVTRGILAELDEPLIISGYFSEKTHPLLAPLVPRVRDFLKEVQIRGEGRVTVEFADPSKDEELETELGEQYQIRSVPFRVSGRNEESVVNSYFHILVRYGDEYEVLPFNKLIEIFATKDEVEVRLRNLEYDVTRAVKKVSQEFRSLEALFARLEKGAKLTAYISPAQLPEDYQEVPARLEKVAEAFKKKSAGKFAYEMKDPSKDPALAEAIQLKYNFRPMPADVFGEKTFYLYLVMDIDGRLEMIYPQGDLKEADLRASVEASIKRATPGFTKTVGLLTETPAAPPSNPMMPPQFQQPKPDPDYRAIEGLVTEEYQVRRVSGDQGIIPTEVDALIVAKPGKLSKKQQYAIDQFLMRGGSVIALTGGYTIKATPRSLEAKKLDKSVSELWGHYGVTVTEAFAMDPRNTQFPVPIQEKRGMYVVESVRMVDYPFFPDIRKDGFLKDHVALRGLPNVALTWGSPLKVADNLGESLKAEVLLKTSAESWQSSSTQLVPTSANLDDDWIKPEGERGAQPVAVALVGQMGSFFAGKPSPLVDTSGAPPQQGQAVDRSGHTIQASVPDARLVVVGSSAFASDLVAGLSQQQSGGLFRGNMQLVRNLVDWSVADTDLLRIRTSGAYARTLIPLEDDERRRWELTNYAVALIALLVLVVIAFTRRRSARPMDLAPEVN